MMNGRARRRLSFLVALVLCVQAAALLVTAPARAEGPGAIMQKAECNQFQIARNDDGFSPVVPLPFTVDFYGERYSSLFVNNNGNVTFGRPLSTYTPFGLSGARTPIIAPFFADVDTRPAGSDVVRYGYGYGTYEGRPAFCVNWINVGYYSFHTDKLNSFQLMLVDRSDVENGAFDIVFNYDKVQWETGDASGGVNGFGGSPARVGFSNGTGDAGYSFELEGSGVSRAFLDSNAATGLIHNSRSSSQLGRYVFKIRGGDVSFLDRLANALFGSRRSGGYVSDPVNVATGNFTLAATDLDFRDQVFGLDWTRTYNSLDASASPLGRGWSANFGSRIEETSTGARMVDWDGRVVSFTRAADGSYARPEEFFGDLRRASDGTFSVHYDRGIVERFDAAGRLARRTNWDGQTVDFHYDGGLLRRAASSTGYALAFSYADGRIARVDASDGRHVAYEYSGGALSRVTDAAGAVTTYEGDAAGRIVRILDADGRVVIRNVYDAAGRVAGQHVPSGRSVTLHYDQEDGRTEVVDDRGARVVYEYDSFGRVTSVTDPHGGVMRKAYDARGNLVSVTGRDGATTAQTFDAHGNLTSRTTPGGVVQRFFYDERDRLVRVDDALDAERRYDYEGDERVPSRLTGETGAVTHADVEAGLVTRVVDPDGVVLRMAYDAARNLVSAADGAGRATTFEYDRAGNLVRRTGPDGATTSLAYDGMRRLLAADDPSGGRWTFRYTDAGRLVGVTDPAGGDERVEYDAAGQAVAETDASGATQRFRYDADGNVVEIVRPDGATRSFEYDAMGRVTKSVDETGAVTRYEYDAMGNPVDVVSPDGSSVRRTVDARGRTVALRDGLGRVTRYEYDDADRLVSVTDPTGAQVRYEYDAAGRVVDVIDPRGGHHRRSYSDAGRLVAVTDPTGRVTRYDYDAGGNPSARTSPGGRVTTFGLDAGGRLARRTSPGGLTTAYGYDAAGRLVAVTDPAGETHRRVYDATGNVARVTDASGATRRFEYDAAGRVARIVDSNGGVTRYEYDARGNLMSRTDAGGGVERYGYDAAGRLTSVTDALGNVARGRYDAMGRLTRVDDASGRTFTLEYDAAGQLVARGFGDGRTVHYAYDGAGRRTEMRFDGVTTSYEYDRMGNLTRVATGGRALEYTYDAAGRRTSMTYPSGARVSYEYDAEGRLARLSHPAAGDVTYGYDADGLLTSERLPRGVERDYRYRDGLLAGYVQRTPEGARETTLEHDAMGRIASETTGGVTTRYGYDASGQLTSVTGGDSGGGNDVAYAYDARGNRVEERRASGRTAYRYDAASRLVEMATPTATTAYAYDAAGRRLSETGGRVTRELRYDARGLPVRVSTATGAATGTPLVEHRSYDGDGRLTAVETTGRETTSSSLLWDVAAPMPQVAVMRRGATESELVYGVGRALAVTGGDAAVFSYDVHGSPLRTDATADLVRGAHYDAFGAPNDAAVKAGPSFGFRGELQVGNLLHLRARDYDMATGAFTTVDPFPGPAGHPTLANPYAYAANDPVNLLDPAGLTVMTDGDVNDCLASLDCTFDQFEAMSVEQRRVWLDGFQSIWGGQHDFAGWFTGIDAILAFADDWNLISSGSWFSVADAGILQGLQDGLARQLTMASSSLNRGADEWQEFFAYRAQAGNDDTTTRTLWGEAEQAATDHGVDIAADLGIDPPLGATAFTSVTNLWRWVVGNNDDIKRVIGDAAQLVAEETCDAGTPFLPDWIDPLDDLCGWGAEKTAELAVDVLYRLAADPRNFTFTYVAAHVVWVASTGAELSFEIAKKIIQELVL